MEKAWRALRTIHPEIPDAVLTFVNAQSRRRMLGYFAQSAWKIKRGAAHEIAISPQLIHEPKDLVGTMLHEAAHAVLHEAGKGGGIGSTPYYHTKEFRDQCVEFGLECVFLNSRYGWALTQWPISGPATIYKKTITDLRRALPAGTGSAKRTRISGGKQPESGHTKITCGCAGGKRVLYVNKTMLLEGGVTCSICGKEFKKRR